MQDVSDDDDCEYNVEIYAIEDQEELSEVADYFESLIEEEEEA